MSAGLPAGTQFQRDAVTAGEAIIVSGGPASPRSAWSPISSTTTPMTTTPTTVRSCRAPELDGVLAAAVRRSSEHLDLGEAEYALRSAVRSAADALGAIRAEAGGVDVADPRRLVEQVLESSGLHRAPDHAPSRALRVLENAAHIDAIITVSSGLMPIGLQSSSEAQIANDALRPLSAVVRSARLAAVSAILHSAWRR